MKVLSWVLAAVLAAMAGVPFGTALVVTAIIAPAAAEQLRLDCGTTISAGGEWRPPFQQAYTRTSAFGMRFHPIDRVWRLHSGVDLVSLPGPGPVVAAASGTITAAGYRGDYGHAVDIDHGGGITSRYAHLARIHPGITPGAVVATGQILGVEGSTGASTGNHLHLEILRDRTPIDPVPFLAARGAPLDGRAVPPTPPPSSTTTAATPLASQVEGGIGFALPAAGTPRLASLTTPPAPIPPRVKALYVAAAARYQLPWTLLAGIGMEETAHGATTATSSAGAQGLMQFMPATFAAYGVDGDHNGTVSITSDADSVFSAANYLTKSGVTKGEAGVRKALYAYNHATWYVNDVLHYAHAYGGGTVAGDPTACATTGTGDPTRTPATGAQVSAVLAWAGRHVGDRYVFGGNGPHAWDCSSFTQAAYRHAGIALPRTAGAQRDWLAAGHGTRITPGRERPGDLIFADSYLGPNAIGHVVIVRDPTAKTTFEAKNTRAGVGSFSYAGVAPGKSIYQVWRVGAGTAPR